MGYFDELNKINEIIKDSKEFNFAQRAIMIDLIEEKKSSPTHIEDFFIGFFEDVTAEEIDFDFKAVLDENSYDAATKEAKSCFKITTRFSELEADSSLLPWLLCAIKYTDELVLHYIQNIKEEDPENNPDFGKERSRYVQINKGGYCAQVAGRIMSNLYIQRNKLEHRTKNDPKKPGKQLIIPPKYNNVKKKILLTFPRALQTFRNSYKAYYN